MLIAASLEDDWRIWKSDGTNGRRESPVRLFSAERTG
jgi:hypothetical protein